MLLKKEKAGLVVTFIYSQKQNVSLICFITTIYSMFILLFSCHGAAWQRKRKRRKCVLHSSCCERTCFNISIPFRKLAKCAKTSSFTCLIPRATLDWNPAPRSPRSQHRAVADLSLMYCVNQCLIVYCVFSDFHRSPFVGMHSSLQEVPSIPSRYNPTPALALH